jgi:hypothetical protein
VGQPAHRFDNADRQGDEQSAKPLEEPLKITWSLWNLTSVHTSERKAACEFQVFEQILALQ